MTDVRRKTFGFVFQSLNLIRAASAIENVMLPAYPLGEDRRRLRDRAQSLLDSLDVAGKAETRIAHLSGGEAQRVAIARALINDPAVLVADEPTANLDSTLAAEFLKIVGGLRGQGRTVLMASHDPRICGAEIVDRVVALEDGRIVERGGAKGPA